MKLVFIDKERQVGNIYSFKFANKTSFSWIAGQSIRLELPTDYLAEERRFTISSAPSEKQIIITTKLSDSHFKQALAKLQPGDAINAFGVEGDFTWPETSSHPPIFLANGLGITPFRSILAEQSHRAQPLAATLLYSYFSGAPVFETELKTWQKTHPQLKLKIFLRQKLNGDLVVENAPKLTSSPIYISGSSHFVNGLRNDLIKNFAVSPRQLKLDEFTGL